MRLGVENKGFDRIDWASASHTRDRKENKQHYRDNFYGLDQGFDCRGSGVVGDNTGPEIEN